MKFHVLPAWIKCPACGLAMLSDASTVRGVSCEIHCGTPKCPQYLKRFKIEFQSIEGKPVFEAAE